MKIGMFTVEAAEGMTALQAHTKEENGVTEITLQLAWTPENAAAGDAFVIRWERPLTGIMYGWSPDCGLRRKIGPDWAGAVGSMISSQAPVTCYYDGSGVNQYCVALSEAQMLVYSRNGIVEENGCLRLQYTLPVGLFTAKYETHLTVRIDERKIPMCEAVAAAAAWWAEDCGITPAFVPPAAKEPC